MNVKKQITNKIEYGLTKKVALFTNARDESHIKEWAAHHLLIGFDYIIIFLAIVWKKKANEFFFLEKKFAIVLKIQIKFVIEKN
jgi:hypothetical protein